MFRKFLINPQMNLGALLFDTTVRWDIELGTKMSHVEIPVSDNPHNE